MNRPSALFSLFLLAILVSPAAGETGIASHYDHPTGNVACPPHPRFDPRAMTAAHRTLPCGTRVRVHLVKPAARRRLPNSLTVTITDRGPFIANRIIDLSIGAARALGFEGLAMVRLEIIH